MKKRFTEEQFIRILKKPEAACGVSERRACAAMAVDRLTVRYQSKRPDDAELRDQVKRIAIERRRFGYRRMQL